jgi:hypothetical protein
VQIEGIHTRPAQASLQPVRRQEEHVETHFDHNRARRIPFDELLGHQRRSCALACRPGLAPRLATCFSRKDRVPLSFPDESVVAFARAP